ncbi:hypothetical protein ACFS2C_06750 [Prauserella oleivorans]|uniref:Lipoprotein n=1 Tax=Prauserella oleivorans TaxID=1478153 RepID=A0ABW5W787_9PSEU
MRRLLPGLFVVLVLLGACGSPAPAEPPAGPVTATAEIMLYPFTETGEPAPGITVVDEAEATCSASTLDLGNPAARRCVTTAGLILHDPCFVRAAPAPDVALCVQNPATGQAVRMTIAQDLGPRPQPELVHAPWFLELEDGRWCVPTAGIGPELDGEKPSFACGGQDFLYGVPDNRAPVWTIAHRDDGAETTQPVRIRTAWY